MPGTPTALLRERARAFLTEARAALTALHVLPAPRYQVPLRVGSDYFGTDLMGAAYTRLEEQLGTDFAARFPPPGSANFESAANWIFALLETAIFYEVRGRLSWRAACTTAIRQWIASLSRPAHRCVAARLLRHVATPGNVPVRVGGVTITPTRLRPGPELEDLLPARRSWCSRPDSPGSLRRSPWPWPQRATRTHMEPSHSPARGSTGSCPLLASPPAPRSAANGRSRGSAGRCST
jgi:hypothetical protein